MRFLLIPLDGTVLFPNMTAAVAADVGDEQRVLVVPRDGMAFHPVMRIGEVLDLALEPAETPAEPVPAS